MNHTPGLWKVTAKPKGWLFIGTDKRQKLATVLMECEEDQANARLIAAAPELLVALENVLFALENEELEIDDIGQHLLDFQIDNIRDAINKATN